MGAYSSACIGNGKSTLEALAIERYLDDLEWEAEEMRTFPTRSRGRGFCRRDTAWNCCGGIVKAGN